MRNIQHRLFGWGLFGVAFLCSQTELNAAPTAERIRRVETGSNIRFSTMVIHPSGRKIYAGEFHPENPLESGLWVFDIDSLGDLTSSDERSYPLLTSMENPKRWVSVSCMVFSRDGRKLYMGIPDHDSKDRRALLVQDINEKGDPVEKPRSYLGGNPSGDVWDILVHPKLDFLYTVGWCCGGSVYAVPLVKGEPSSETRGFRVAMDGASLVLNPSCDTLIVGGHHPFAIKVVGMDGGGELEESNDRTSRYFKASDGMGYPRMHLIGSTLFFSDANMLCSWTLDKNCEPVGNLKRYPEVRTGINDGRGDQMTVVGGSLYVAGYEVETDKASKKEIAKAFRVFEFKPDDKGNLGKPVYTSQTFDESYCCCLVVSEKTGMIYVNYRR